MRTSGVDSLEQVKAVGVRFDGNMLYVMLSDGREVGLPIDRIGWLDWLAHATPSQRELWTLEPDGYAVYWEGLDDGIEVRHILEAQPIA